MRPVTLTPFGPRRGRVVALPESQGETHQGPVSPELAALARLDEVYRRLVAVMFNFVPTSGHPGGSISAGRLSQALLFDSLDYDVSAPLRDDADVVVYAAGHKALGLYALWALRDEIVRWGAPQLLPGDERLRLRFEDLVGFRRNPTTRTPLFAALAAKPLDGHPTPATPFVRLATGASGVGLASAVGLALALVDYYGPSAPRVHVIEGEAGLTPGRASEALAAAGTASLRNLVLHVDWNQSSIDSDAVCREEGRLGDYVQWEPGELCHLHDWNVVLVPDGHDLRQIQTAQRQALAFENHQPTAVVYRTTKGWRYGVEGARSHGAGHGFCSPEFFAAANRNVAEGRRQVRCEKEPPCRGADREQVERCYWTALEVLRDQLHDDQPLVAYLTARVEESRERLDSARRQSRAGAPHIEILGAAANDLASAPAGTVVPRPGSTTTLRESLALVLQQLNHATDGGLLVAAADLLGSTSIRLAGAGFRPGFFNAATNPEARLIAAGGICEDAMAGILSGVSMAGHHVGVGSSYAAFLAPLGHIAARLHAIGIQGLRNLGAESFRPLLLVCAHAGIETGEDGPTHADPQCLQLLQGNYPPGALMTLTPWEPQEIPTLLSAALGRRPAVIAVFVTRPPKVVPDRASLGLAPAASAAAGVYLLRKARRPRDGVVVLQGSEVTYAFVDRTLPLLEAAGVELDAYYVASVELFESLAAAQQEALFPERDRAAAVGVTGFTLPTLLPWITSDRGRRASLHPFAGGRFLGSGPADMVLAEAGLIGDRQFAHLLRFVRGEST